MEGTLGGASRVEPGAALIARAFRQLPSHDARAGGARPAAWDTNFAELRSSAKSRIPRGLEEAWASARHRAGCGLLASLRHAWVSVDALLYLWDYGVEDPIVFSVPADSAIITVAACSPRAHTFAPEVFCLLVVATRLSVSLVGLRHGGAGGAGQTIGSELALATPEGRAALAAPGHLQLVALDGCSAPADGSLFRRILSAGDGRIFLFGDAPQVFELLTAPHVGWLRPRCRLVRHSVAGGVWRPWARPEHVRLLECCAGSPDHLFTVDDAGTLRMHCINDGHGRDAAGPASITEICAMTPADLVAQSIALQGAPLASASIVHVFPAVGHDGRLGLHAATAAGERIHLVARPEQGRSVFQLVSASQPQPWASVVRSRALCVDNHRDPCLHSDGTWIYAAQRPGSTTTDLHISVPVDRFVGDCTPADMQTVQRIESAVLEIAQPTYVGAFAKSPDDMLGQKFESQGCQSFILFLPDGVQTLTITRHALQAKRPPASAEECRAYLAQLSHPRSMVEDTTTWMWSLDDAHLLSFEEQRCRMLIDNDVPPLELGRWFGGLLQLLAFAFRPIWEAPLLVYTQSRLGVLAFPGRRRTDSLRLAFSEDQVNHVLTQLRGALRFVRQSMPDLHAQAPASVPSKASARFRMYTHENCTEGGTQSQVRYLLRSVVDIADRAVQVCGLISIMYAHRCVDTVLESSVIRNHVLIELTQRPLHTIVQTPADLNPAVLLCTALLSEKGLKPQGCGPPEKGGAGDLYKDIHELCPLIFAQVDLSQCVRGGASSGDSLNAEPSSELLHRYVQSFSPGAQEDQWALVARGIRAMAAEDAVGAAEICCEKILQLQVLDAAAPEHARGLLKALLEGLRPDERSREALESLLAATRARPPAALDQFEEGLPFVHAVVIDGLIQCPRLHGILEDLLLVATEVDAEAFLRARCATSPVAGDCLWRLYKQRGQDSLAAGVLLQLVERPDVDYGLPQRLDYLRLALDHAIAAAQAPEHGVAMAKAAETLQIRADVASRVQVPLRAELQLLARDVRIPVDIRELATRRAEDLQILQGLEELYRVALEFSLFHLVLMVLDVYGAELGQEAVASVWAGLVFGSEASPYSPSRLVAQHRVPMAHGCFPLLAIRENVPFFAKSGITGTASSGSESAGDFLLQDRIESLLAELRCLTGPASVIWDVRCLVALFEYAACLWSRALPSASSAASSLPARRSSSGQHAPVGLDASCAWVALRVLPEAPFKFTLPEVVAFYAEMLVHLPTWARDLRAMLPPGAPGATSTRAPAVTAVSLDEEDLRLHLSEVVLCALSQWVEQAEEGEGAEALAEFRAAWLRTADGLLAGLGLRLNSQQGDARARKLLPEVLRLEAAGRIICGGRARTHGAPPGGLRSASSGAVRA